jgi:hypothetical protein
VERSDTVFTHRLDKDSRIWAQKDGVPQNGTAPTTSWLFNEVLTDEYLLPVQPGAPPGVYRVEIGLYDAIAGVRLPVFDDRGEPQGDRILLDKSVTIPTAGN